MMNPQGKKSGQIRPIVGHHAAWGLISSRFRIQPYTLTPGSTDTMRVRVREKIDIMGVGMDVLEMEGIFTVRRDHPVNAEGSSEVNWENSFIKTEFRTLELYGESPVFGTVRVSLDPDHPSVGEVGHSGEASIGGGHCIAELVPEIELPDLGLKLSTGGQPVTLRSKVIQIPPVGDVARSEGTTKLLDDSGNTVGELVSSDIEVGEVLFSIPLGSTSAEGEKPRAELVQTRFSNVPASGSSFFTRTPLKG